ncbi:MAG TPA: heliorhodopsin HeR [Candidatus Limnocylindrales bacterium]|nr:heliorhodopsin HeR [Candidatus Limnocylindrales bacterium]
MNVATREHEQGAPASATTTVSSTETLTPERARSLARWNRSLTLLHGLQFLVMLAIANTSVAFAPFVPTVKVRLVDGVFAGIEKTQVQLFSMPLAWVIASFLAMSAVAHFTAGWPLRRRYEAWLARGMNPLRWVEYSFSSTVMIVAIAWLSFIQDLPALIAIAACNVAMILFGWSMEAANEGRRDRPDWKHFIFGCIAGIAPWIGIVSVLLAYGAQPDLPEGAGIPAFVYVIVATLFVTFNVFAVTMVLQYRRVGRWRDYLVGEKTYMVMSLVAKSALAWQVFSGTLRPGG